MYFTYLLTYILYFHNIINSWKTTLVEMASCRFTSSMILVLQLIHYYDKHFDCIIAKVYSRIGLLLRSFVSRNLNVFRQAHAPYPVYQTTLKLRVEWIVPSFKYANKLVGLSTATLYAKLNWIARVFLSWTSLCALYRYFRISSSNMWSNSVLWSV